jgi:hypothetical protein
MSRLDNESFKGILAEAPTPYEAVRGSMQGYAASIISSFSERTGSKTLQSMAESLRRQDIMSVTQVTNVRKTMIGTAQKPGQLMLIARDAEAIRLARNSNTIVSSKILQANSWLRRNFNSLSSDTDELISRAMETVVMDVNRAAQQRQGFRFLGGLMHGESVALRQQLPAFDLFALNDIVPLKVRRLMTDTFGEMGPVSRQVTEVDLKQFAQEGAFDGQMVHHNGQAWIYRGRARDGNSIIQNPVTRGVTDIRRRPLHLTAEALYKVTDEGVAAIRARTLGRIEAGDVPLSYPLRIISAEDGLIYDAVFAARTMRVFKNTDQLTQYLKDSRKLKAKQVDALTFKEKAEIASTLIKEDGAILLDENTATLLIGENTKLRLGRRYGTVSEVASDGLSTDRRISLSFRNLADAYLGDSGVGLGARDAVYWRNLMALETKRDMLRNLDASDRAFLNQTDLLATEQSLEARAAQRNAEVRDTDALDVRVTAGDGKQPIGVARTREEAADLLDEVENGMNETGAKLSKEQDRKNAIRNPEAERADPNRSTSPDDSRIDGDGGGVGGGGSGGTMAGGGGGQAPEPQTIAHPLEAGPVRRMIDNIRISGFGQFAVPTETVMQAVESRGLANAWSRFYRPIQEGKQQIGALINLKRAELGGRSILRQVEKIDKLQRRAVKVGGDERVRSIQKGIETLSRDEISEVGGLLPRGMNNDELGLAAEIVGRDLQHDISRMYRAEQVIRAFTKNRQTFVEDFAPNMIRRPDIDDIEKATLGRLLKQAQEEGDGPINKYLASLTEDQKWLVEQLGERRGLSPDDFSVMAVGRWANAPDTGGLPGRQWAFATENITKQEAELITEFDSLMRVMAEETGIDTKRLVGGYFPHWRQWQRAGFAPDELGDIPPHLRRFMGDMLSTGQAQATMPPAEAALRYVIGGFNDRFDISKLAQAAVEESDKLLKNSQIEWNKGNRIAARDMARAAGAMNRYGRGVLGAGETGTQQIGKWMSKTLSVLGIDVDSRKIGQLADNLQGLMYSTWIPYRPYTVARNMTQTLFTTFPIVGNVDYAVGLAKAMPGSATWDIAAKRGVLGQQARTALTTDVQATVGGGVFNLIERAGRRGFDWYQAPDQWGRAVAYFAMENRFNREYAKYLKHGNLDRFMSKSKTRLMGPAVEKVARQLVLEGRNAEAADIVGKALARMTHYRYGNMNAPLLWNTAPGRIFGQFGTWTINWADMWMNVMRNGTAMDRTSFLAKQAAVQLGVTALGLEVFGADLTGRVSFQTFIFEGGPWADTSKDLAMLTIGTEPERTMATRNLQYRFTNIFDPRAGIMPFSGSVKELTQMVTTVVEEGTLAEEPYVSEQGGTLRTYRPNAKVNSTLIGSFLYDRLNIPQPADVVADVIGR